MLKLYCFLTGEDYKELSKDTVASKKKINMLAVSILLPVIIWGSFGYPLFSGLLQFSPILSGAATLLMCTVIFIIERSVVMVSGNSWIKYSRIAIAVIMSLIGATLFDMTLFRADIDQHLAKMQRQGTETELASLDSIWNQRIGKQEAKVEKARRQWDQAMKRVQDEVTGTRGTGIAGYGSITKAMIESADKYLLILEMETAKLDSIAGRYEEVRAEKEQLITSTLSNATLLKRIGAMHDLAFSDIYIGTTYVLFVLFIGLLESFVLMLKYNASKTNYERRIELAEEIGERRMKRISEIGEGLGRSAGQYESNESLNKHIPDMKLSGNGTYRTDMLNNNNQT